MGTAPLIRVVLDSNILFSAVISPIGPPHRIYQAWRARKFELATCSIQIAEVRRAGRYAKLRDILMPHEVGRMIDEPHGTLNISARSREHETLDPDDAWLLSLAEAARADYLVTGDRRAGLLSRKRIGTARIATAATFRRSALSARR